VPNATLNFFSLLASNNFFLIANSATNPVTARSARLRREANTLFVQPNLAVNPRSNQFSAKPEG